MWLLDIAVAGILGVGLATSAPTDSPKTASQLAAELNALTLDALQASEPQRLSNSNPERCRPCTLQTAKIRREWSTLSREQRIAYTESVKCLFNSPSKADPVWAPGAKNRYDDFVAVHINQTGIIHGTGNFLTWHRLFLAAYEHALRVECGYKGDLPYWNWFEYQDDLAKSPIFDGSDASMGGDGAFFAHNGSVSGRNNIFLPSGNGGGCVTTGPFANVTLNLGPLAPGMVGLANVPITTPLAHNPRCLRRDLTSFATKNWMTYENLFNLTMGPASTGIFMFQEELQGRFDDGFLGMHATGHMAGGGDGSDLFASTADPFFFLHHAMLDRVYWMWQSLHPLEANKVAGVTQLAVPTSPAATVEDVQDLVILGVKPRKIKELFDTLGGGGSPFCYIYQ